MSEEIPNKFTDSKKPLPKGWKWVKLGDVCSFQYGASLTSQMRNKGTIPVYGSNGIVGYHNNSLTHSKTIIIGRKGSVGEIHFSPIPCFPIDTTYFIDNTKNNSDLFWFSLLLKFLNLRELNKAAAIPGLNREDAYKLEIPLPPIAEQKRIATILSEQLATVERARKAAQEQLEAAKALPAAYLREVFESEEAKKWEKVQFENVAILQRGYDLPSQNQITGKYPIITSSGVNGTHHEYKEKAPGVVTGRSGSIGKVHYCEKDYWPHNTTLFVKSFMGNYPRYIYYLLQSIDLRKVCSGSGVPTLDRKEVHKLIVRHPNLNKQKEIAFYLDKKFQYSENLLAYLSSQYQAINKLPAALLQRAFSGEL